MHEVHKICGIPEAADFLDVSVFTIRSWVQQRKLPYYKVGRCIKFKVKDLQEALEDARIEAISAK